MKKRNKIAVMAGIVIIAISIGISSQQNSKADIQTKNTIIDYGNEAWNNQVTKILPKQNQIGKQWIPLWSDSSKEFIQGEDPVTNTRTIAKNEITSTSYSYKNPDIGVIQVLVWNGEWVSEWDHNLAVDAVLQQVDAQIEKKIENPRLSKNCTMGYYDLYGEKENSNKFDLLFSECSKNNFRIRVNLAEGEFSDDGIESVISFSNQVIEQIR